MFFELSKKVRYLSVVVDDVVVVYCETITVTADVSLNPPLSVAVTVNDNAVPE